MALVLLFGSGERGADGSACRILVPTVDRSIAGPEMEFQWPIHSSAGARLSLLAFFHGRDTCKLRFEGNGWRDCSNCHVGSPCKSLTAALVA